VTASSPATKSDAVCSITVRCSCVSAAQSAGSREKSRSDGFQMASRFAFSYSRIGSPSVSRLRATVSNATWTILLRNV
jgi:hypothetical protein